jgi:hypothetical protein
VEVRSLTCTPRGLALTTQTQLLEWNGAAWDVHPLPPEAAISYATIHTDRGTLVTPTAGSLRVGTNGSWRIVEASHRPPRTLPPGSTWGVRVAALADRVVVLDPPGTDTETAVLSVVDVG